MHRAFRWFLYSILVLVAAIWLTLGLLKPEHLKGPFVAWVQQQTGLPLEIGKLNYNPLFPNVVLAENVSLGPDLKADKVYLEIASGSWWQRQLHIAHLDIIRPQIKWQPGLNLPQPLRQLQIDDLTIDKMKLSWNNGSLDGGSLHLTNWQPIRDGEVLPFADVKFDASVEVHVVLGVDPRGSLVDLQQVCMAQPTSLPVLEMAQHSPPPAPRLVRN